MHSHSENEHNHNHNHNHESQGNIKVAFLLNLSFTILEIIGGLWSNSMAILSDALHDLGDSLSLGIAWYLEKYSKKEPDQKFSFGYSRFSLLGSLINGFILLIGSVFILINSIPRIFKPEEVNPYGMLLFAILGITINGLAVLRLKKGSSYNEKLVSWHLLEDVMGWVAILIASIVLLFKNIPIIDPILSAFITLYVLYNVIKNLKEILRVFLQGVPKNFSIPKIEQKILESTDAISIYHTHLWSLEGEKNLLATHIIVSDGTSQADIIGLKEKIRSLMLDEGIDHVTIEIDYASEVKTSFDF